MSEKVSPVIAAVKAIIKNNNKFLVLKAQISDDLFFWDLPGGKVEQGESPEEALHREIREEVFLDIEIEKIIGAWWFVKEIDSKQIMCTTYQCKPLTENIDISQNPGLDNIQEYKWVTKEEFLQDEYIVSHKSLKQLISQI